MCFSLPVSGKQQSSGVSCLHYSRLRCAEGLWLTELKDSDSTHALLEWTHQRRHALHITISFIALIALLLCQSRMCARDCVQATTTTRMCLVSTFLQLSTLLMTAHQSCRYSDTAFAVCPFLENHFYLTPKWTPPTPTHTYVHYLSSTKLYDSYFAYYTWWHISTSTHFPVFSFHRPKFHHVSPLTNKPLLLA